MTRKAADRDVLAQPFADAESTPPLAAITPLAASRMDCFFPAANADSSVVRAVRNAASRSPATAINLAWAGLNETPLVPSNIAVNAGTRRAGMESPEIELSHFLHSASSRR